MFDSPLVARTLAGLSLICAATAICLVMLQSRFDTNSSYNEILAARGDPWLAWNRLLASTACLVGAMLAVGLTVCLVARPSRSVAAMLVVAIVTSIVSGVVVLLWSV